MELDRSVVGVAGLSIPVLAFALIGREHEGFTTGHVEGFVLVEDGLDEVIAGRKSGEVGDGVADGRGVDDERRVGSGVVGVDAEALSGGVGFVELVAGLFCFFAGLGEFGEDDDEVAVERGRARDGDFDAQRCLGGGGRGEGKGKQQ